jgi:hypothetical protein
MKPNWVCERCAMWSRKYSVRRHINNKHQGYSRVIPYLEYFVGRQSGFYAPSAPPLYGSKKRTDPLDIFMDEYYRELARRTVDQKFSTKPFWAKSFVKRGYWTFGYKTKHMRSHHNKQFASNLSSFDVQFESYFDS